MSCEMLTPYAGDAGILLLMTESWLLEKWSHRVCRIALFLIFLRCQFQGDGQGKKQCFVLSQHECITALKERGPLWSWSYESCSGELYSIQHYVINLIS